MPNLESKKAISISSSIKVKDLAQALNLPVPRVIRELMKNNIYATINEEIDAETAAIIAEDLGFKVEIREELVEEKGRLSARAGLSELKLFPRPPVVAVMGHVDHGKTTLLDYIRKTDVAGRESGGITQQIGAYQVKHKDRLITFLDTPGHEAFQRMRERGAHLTDIALLVVAADDGVKPQTREAIHHIRKAGIPLVLALNKIDKKEANPPRVKQELAKEGLEISEWGGEVPTKEISAKTGQGVGELLDLIFKVAEKKGFKAPQEGPALGTVIESYISSQRGLEATILVQAGVFRTGEMISFGRSCGKIRRMEDWEGRIVPEAKPGTPVKIIGFSDLPAVGSLVQAGEMAGEENLAHSTGREKALGEIRKKGLNPKVKRLNLVIKADTEGGSEAILENLAGLKAEEVAPFIVTEGIGNITESDVLRAHLTCAKLLGFKVKATPVATKLAKQLGIKINTYEVIYELTAVVKKGLEEMMEPEVELKELGKLKVLAIFRTEKDKMIVGGKVTEGNVEAGSNVRVKREGAIIGEGRLGELQSQKQKVEKVASGKEAGIKFSGTIEIAVGDILEFYKIEKKKKSL